MLGPVTLFCKKKVMERQILEDFSKLFGKCCRYVGSESSKNISEQWDSLNKILSRILGWMIFLLQHMEDRVRHVAMQMAHKFTNSTRDRIARVPVQLVHSWDQYIDVSQRRWKTELLHLLFTSWAFLANIKLRFELLHAMLKMSYVGFVVNLTAPISTAVALKFCTLSIRSCKILSQKRRQACTV